MEIDESSAMIGVGGGMTRQQSVEIEEDEERVLLEALKLEMYNKVGIKRLEVRQTCVNKPSHACTLLFLTFYKLLQLSLLILIYDINV